MIYLTYKASDFTKWYPIHITFFCKNFKKHTYKINNVIYTENSAEFEKAIEKEKFVWELSK